MQEKTKNIKQKAIQYFCLIKNITKKQYQASYSQCGEDLICSYIFKQLNIKKPTYLDIGAFHPTNKSNTYLFYKNKSNGVCVEPDKSLADYFKKKRPRDLCLNVGVSPTGKFEEKNFYTMSAKALNTFSEDEARKYEAFGTHRIEKINKVKIIPINDIIKSNFNECPNFISIDVEGLDFDVLKNLDIQKYRPEIFCIETINYSEDNTERKDARISKYMVDNGYMIHSDTYINTIYVEKNKWKKR